MDPVTKYAQDVLAGKIVAGPYVRASCQRHLDDLKRVGGEIYFDVNHARWALEFFPTVLRLSEGQFEGKPFELDPSQQFIVGSLFGWRKEGNLRRFNRAYIEQGKGNGKSPLAAGIGLYGTLADKEPGAQVYAAAAKMDQAQILFQDAVKMVQKSPMLLDRLTPSGVNPVYKLTHLKSQSFFKPLGRDTGKTGSGLRPHFVLLDELHEHPDRTTLDMLEAGFKFRRQPLLVMITNSGSDLKSVCRQEHEHAVAVAQQDIEDDATFSYVCALDEDDDPFNDESCWFKANPLLGKTLTVDYLREAVKRAKAIPGKENKIRRLHFCQWTDSDTAWISRESWTACEDPAMTLDEFEGKDCWLGLDLGATRDLTAVAIVFHDGETADGLSKYALFCYGFTPKDTLLERAKRDRAPYDVWAKTPFLTATPGKVVRFDYVVDFIVEIGAKFEIQSLAYDRWLIRNFELALEDSQLELNIVEHPQGVTRRKDSPLFMPGSIDTMEELILEGRLRIHANPVLRSSVASVAMWEAPTGLRRFDKPHATARIDLAVASAMAIGNATHGLEVFDLDSFLNDPVIA